MSQPSIRIAVGDYDRTRALVDGSVGVQGIETRFATGDLEAIFSQAFQTAEYEVTELSFSNFLIASVRGGCPYLALPIFPSRSFRHSAVYVRAGSGIATPADLAGKRIGLREYSNTVALVARGMLSDEYGFDPGSCEWFAGDVDHVERDAIDPRNWPKEVSIRAVQGRTLSSMIEAGELDALIAYTPPAAFGHAGVGRLFPDWREVEKDYYARTRRFPIMHVIALRRDVAEANPSLPKALLAAFDQAKQAAQDRLAIHQALPIMLPWMQAEAEGTQALMGRDFWPYGFEANRDMIETQIRWSHEQGLIPRRPTAEELFPGC
ncbi:PhnD/SsuA/transferrin family substrate-binding protein [Pigmentiphaga sp.]|uniref:PhnD/SsuA/transferrin family substrate-binding protein n=1 Tax=Pigmentiphaga sp. TaxID=1977564 RepID=UPI0025CD5336|nr:PhnD/SsuA/transferrin family substrate-binding protein [Pigmentiphaga sp.]